MLRDLGDLEYYSALRAAAEREEGADLEPYYGTGDPLSGLLPEDVVRNEPPSKHRLLRYLRQEILPTTFCVGCGGGTVLNAFAHAIDEMKIDPR